MPLPHIAVITTEELKSAGAENVSTKHIELPQASKLFNGILSPYVKKVGNYLEESKAIIIFSVISQHIVNHFFKVINSPHNIA